jgi:hypothetical protein
MTFTNIGSGLTDKIIYEGIITQAISDESVSWAIRSADENLVTGKVFNKAFNLNNEEINSLHTFDEILSSNSAIDTIANSNTALDALFSRMVVNSYFCSLIKGSSTRILNLDNGSPITIPVMTSNTTPSGVALCSNHLEGYDACNAMTKVFASECGWVSETITNQWIQYKFTQPVWCYKATIFNNWIKYDAHVKNFKVQYSNDGIIFFDAIDGIADQSITVQTFNVCAPNSKANYWRISCIDNWGNLTYMAIGDVDFYCI